MSAHAKLYAANYAMSGELSFVPWMLKQIRDRQATIVRVHVSGDFYSTDYVFKWLHIAKKCPATQFFGYTRSWQPDKGVSYPVLNQLASLPNVHLWWSADKDTGKPIQSRHARVAYMMTSDTDLPNYSADLLFRTNTDTITKQILGTLVCPAENGVAMENSMTCSRCQFCFTRKAIQKPKMPVLPAALVQLSNPIVVSQ